MRPILPVEDRERTEGKYLRARVRVANLEKKSDLCSPYGGMPVRFSENEKPSGNEGRVCVATLPPLILL
jgi:hypothetical protein